MSVLSGIGQKPSVYADGRTTTITSNAGGGNVQGVTLTSGTTYTFINTPFPFGKGTYGISINWDLTGNNTTAFRRITIETLFTGLLLPQPLNSTDVLIGTTLPSTDTFNFSAINLADYTTNDPPNLSITFKPVFTGTAPTVTSAYIYLYKLSD